MELNQVARDKGLTKEEFESKYIEKRQPVILTDFAKNWNAWDKWDFEYFKEIAGEHKVDLYGDWKENDPEKVERTPVKQMKFANYLNLIENEPTDLRIFLFNLFEVAPKLRDDIDFPDIIDNWITQMPFMFFGGKGSDVRFHYDIDMSHVFITQISGKKKITLFDQDQNDFLYKLPLTTHSAVDLGNANYSKFPALEYAEGWEANIEKGETLFMPGGMWHYIQYTTEGASISLRALNKKPKHFLQGAFNVLMGRKMDAILDKYVPNWASYKNQKAFEHARAAIEAVESN